MDLHGVNQFYLILHGFPRGSGDRRCCQAADKVGETLKAQARDIQASMETSRKMEIGFIEKIDERIKSASKSTYDI